MRKELVIVTLVLAAAAAFGALGDVVTSFPAPYKNPTSLARANNPYYMWVYTNAGLGYTYRINAETGSVCATYMTIHGHYVRGLSYQYGGYLYIGNWYTKYIYKHDTSDINDIYDGYPAQHKMTGGLAVMATDDGGLGASSIWSTCNYPSRAFLHLISNGSILGSFPGKSDGMPDPAWDWRNQILWTGGVYNRVTGYNGYGSIVASFTIPAAYPQGMVYYNSYLWISTTADHRIWKVHCPEGLDSTAVRPSSLGRVKAVYK